MPVFSHSPSAPKAVVVEGDTYLKTDWMDSGDDPALSPTVFLVEQSPNVSLRTHFHRNNQFQLFVRGGGSLGPHKIGALTVHYAGAYSGYGPLVADERGIAYFTLRSVFETGSLTMAQHADQMKRGPKRQLHSQPVHVTDNEKLATLATPHVKDLIPFEADCVGARLYTLPPAARQTGTVLSGSAGQFYVVVAGSLHVDDQVVQTWGIVFVGSEEKRLEFKAGDLGAQVVCMQLPHKAEQYI